MVEQPVLLRRAVADAARSTYERGMEEGADPARVWLAIADGILAHADGLREPALVAAMERVLSRVDDLLKAARWDDAMRWMTVPGDTAYRLRLEEGTMLEVLHRRTLGLAGKDVMEEER